MDFQVKIFFLITYKKNMRDFVANFFFSKLKFLLIYFRLNKCNNVMTLELKLKLHSRTTLFQNYLI